MKKHIYWLALGLILIISCQKEESFELGNSPSGGTLQDDASGDCLPKTVNGVYAVGQALVPAINNLTVQVNVTKTGTYTVYTDTVNGYFFRGTGNFTALGANTVTLRGNGTPFAAGTNNFVVRFDTTVCDIQVNVVSVGAGTLAGNPGACAPITVNGAYAVGTPLTAGNSAQVQVNVTTAGAFNFTTDTVAGIWFNFSGSLGTGPQPVILQARGGPPTGTTGTKTFTVKLGSSRCTFDVPLAAAGVGSLGGGPGACAPITVNGTYTAGSALTAGHNVQVQVNVTTPGVFTISTNTVNGYSFSFSGNLTTSGLVTLNSTGTPLAAGTNNFTVTLAGSPASTCTFSVPVAAAGVASYTVDCATAVPSGLYENGTQLNICNTVDIDVNVTTPGTYTITTAPAVNGIIFSKSGTFAAPGLVVVTLQGSGTPTASGNFNYTVVGASCSFPLTVDINIGEDWKFTITSPAPSTIYRGQDDGSTLQAAGPAVVFSMLGSNSAASDDFRITLIDMNGTIANNETYVSTATASNSAQFIYMRECESDPYTAGPSVTGVSMTFTVTNHNVAAKTISGTFTGTAKNGAGQIITIASGTFTGTYP